MPGAEVLLSHRIRPAKASTAIGGVAVAEAAVEERQLLKSLRWYDGFVIALCNPGFLIGSLGLSVGALGGRGAVCPRGVPGRRARRLGRDVPLGDLGDDRPAVELDLLGDGGDVPEPVGRDLALRAR